MGWVICSDAVMESCDAILIFVADRELKENMIIAIPNVKDDGEVLYTVRVEHEWEPPRCGVPKRPVEKPKK
ncbi:hypothetical protein Tco_0041618 [Tanacetum coccineum]